ncbi:MAG: acyl-ACP--UDP-N-acetylglucosamine O-acyltransferase [Candidatus Coatesbacteria bacterium]|nr:acyl-ACP--UDP-N-acetylglucosamine O-acyltransferase [Candidatus Coatesbacteria bacterium]
MKIHDTAIIHPTATIGDDVEIGAYSIIHSDVTIGNRCRIASHVIIQDRTTMGEDNIIYDGAIIGNKPQDLKYKGSPSRVRIGDRNTIREYATINIASDTTEDTVISSDCLLMAYVHIAHNCQIGNNVVIANSCNLAGHVVIEDWAVIGGMVPIHQFVRIGAHVMVGAFFKVAQDLVPYILFARNPAQPIGINSVGLKRRGFSEESMLGLKEAFKILFMRDYNTREACNILEKELGHLDEVKNIVSFVRNSKRGIATKRKSDYEKNQTS